MVAMQQRIGLTYSSNAGAMYRRMAPTFPYQRAGFLFAESNPARDDWLAVTNDLSQPFATHVPMERRILVISEPSPMNGYPPEYINQFGVLLSPTGSMDSSGAGTHLMRRYHGFLVFRLIMDHRFRFLNWSICRRRRNDRKCRWWFRTRSSIKAIGTGFDF